MESFNFYTNLMNFNTPIILTLCFFLKKGNCSSHREENKTCESPKTGGKALI